MKRQNKNITFTEEQIQEKEDTNQLSRWKCGLLNKNEGCICYDEVKEYLDEKLIGWRDNYDDISLKNANDIVKRAKIREISGKNLLPKYHYNKNKKYTEEQLQENKDSQKLSNWKRSLKGQRGKISKNLIDYLNENLNGWSIEKNLKEELQEEELCFDDVIIEEPDPEPIVKKSAKLQRQKVWIKDDTQRQTTNIRQKTKSELQKYHSRYIAMRSDNLAQRFRTNRKEFIEYHSVRDQNLETFDKSDRPHERIIAELNKIKTKRQKLVVDMGCGLAKIAEHFKSDRRFEFINYDHVSTKENITECDISHIPSEDNSVEICIMSFALWGSNCEEYITEAYRVLETGGKLYIIDSTKRWCDLNYESGIIEDGMEGCKLKNILVEKSFQIINCNIDKWCLFVCEKV